MLKGLMAEDLKILQKVLDAGYLINFYKEERVTEEGVFHPLVQHHYQSNVSTITEEEFYVITHKDKEEGQLVVDEVFESPKEAIDYIFDHLETFEGVVS